MLPLYSGKTGGFGCLLRFGENGPAVESLTEWDATPSKISSFTATLEPAGENATGVGTAGNLLSEAEFKLDGEFEFEDVIVDDALSPDGTEVSVSNGKWVVPKAATVKFLRDDEAYEVTKNEDNPAQLKLKYTSKTGTFQGSFKVFGVTETGKSKKYTATVTGAVIDSIGYGTATIKKVGSVPVMIAE